MYLSYWLRLLCLVFATAALTLTAFSMLLWLLRSISRQEFAHFGARWQERLCFAEQIGPHLTGFAIALAVVAPAYIRNENNRLDERVGLVCVCAAVLVGVRYVHALARAIYLLHTSRPWRGLPRYLLAGEPEFHIAEIEQPVLAVTGLLSPRIIVSRPLFDSGALSPEKFEVALAHERAHLRQFDSLKLFVLSSLAFSGHRSKQLRRWRQAAEYAADDEAVVGSRSRSILLAETLLVVAKLVGSRRQASLDLELLSHEENLQKRIDRLLNSNAASLPQPGPTKALAAVAALLTGAGLIIPLALLSSPEFAEYLLHLG